MDIIEKLLDKIMIQIDRTMPKSRIIPKDKAAHIAGGILIGMGLTLVTQPVIALIGVIAVGIAKELYDLMYNEFVEKKHSVEGLDVLATVLGGSIGIGAVLLIRYLVS